MPSFSIPTPCIIPLRIPIFGEHRNIDTKTKIELLCETSLPNVEIFYTLDGTKPQPYAGIVQGSKIHKYSSPFYLPPGKVTIKALAIQAQLKSMCSNVVTKCFHVDDAEPQSSKKTCKKKKKQKQPINTQHEPENVTKNSDENADVLPSQPVLEENFESFLGIEENKVEEIKQEKDDLSFNLDVTQVNERISSPIIEENESMDEIQELLQAKAIDEFPFNPSDDSSLSDAQEYLEKAKETASFFDLPHANLANIGCLTCEMPLQHCFSCNKVNNVISSYCDKCGEKLVQECNNCKESNPSIAVYCQYCGKKIKDDQKVHKNDNHKEKSSLSRLDKSLLAKPQMSDYGIQTTTFLCNKLTQTSPVQSDKKFFSEAKKLPKHSPGRGYFRQQLDYICNHLKAHAYNNIEFRKTISEPALGNFINAEVTEEENCIIVKAIFSQLVKETHSVKDEEK